VKKELATFQGSGAYVIYAGIDEEVVKGLPADHLIVGSSVQSEVDSTIDLSHFSFASASTWDCRGPANKRAVTISFSSDVEQWFTYQSDPDDHETKDQSALELAWQVLHAQVPELRSGIEVIDTATPATYYDSTRRKLGMVRGVRQSGAVAHSKTLSHTTTLPNVFMVGDTIVTAASVEQVSDSALNLTNKIHPTTRSRG
jgi:phytoene dehydrogenase-like protein